MNLDSVIDDVYVPIEVIRNHLGTLLDAGMRRCDIAREAGVADSTITSYLRTTATNREPVKTKVHALMARRILRVGTSAATITTTDSAPTQRRLQALIIGGYSRAMIATRSGASPAQLLSAPTVTRADEASIERLYLTLARQRPEYGSDAVRDQAQAERAHAAQLGWRPASHWRDIAAGTPATPADAGIDHVAIDAVIAGIAAPLSDREYAAAIERLRQQNVPKTRIAAILDVPYSSIPIIEAKVREGKHLGIGAGKAAATATTNGDSTRHVPTEIVVRHVKRFIDQGCPVPKVAAAAGISGQTLRNYLGKNQHRPAPAQVPAAIAAKLLAVKAENIQGWALRVDAAPTQRRLQALTVHGWPRSMVAAAIGLHHDAIEHIYRSATVLASTRDAIANHYARVAFGPQPEYSSIRQRGHASSLARDAAAAGWHGPLDWTDIELGILDEDVAVRDVADRLRVRVDEGQADEAPLEAVRAHINTLLDAGWTPPAIAAAARVSGTSVRNYVRDFDHAPKVISPTIGRRILGLRPADAPTERRVPSEAARSRLRSLAEQGHTRRELSERLTCSRRTVDGLLADVETVPEHLDTLIARLHKHVVEQGKPIDAFRGRRRRPHAPQPVPATPTSAAADEVDDVAVERFLDGEDITLTFAERKQAALTLYQRGESNAQILERVGVRWKTWMKWRSEVTGGTEVASEPDERVAA